MGTFSGENLPLDSLLLMLIHFGVFWRRLLFVARFPGVLHFEKPWWHR